MTILESKGNIHFVKYDNGLYAVDKITKSIGMSLYVSENEQETREYFKNI